MLCVDVLAVTPGIAAWCFQIPGQRWKADLQTRQQVEDGLEGGEHMSHRLLGADSDLTGHVPSTVQVYSQTQCTIKLLKPVHHIRDQVADSRTSTYVTQLGELAADVRNVSNNACICTP